MNELFYGIISGLIVLILVELFRSFVLPFLKGKQNHVPDIAGSWIGFDINGDGKEIECSSLHINQIGTKITAKAVRNDRTFFYKGYLSSGQIILNFEQIEGNGYIIGTMVLHLAGNLNSLTGKSTFFNHDEGRVITVDKIYRKGTQNLTKGVEMAQTEKFTHNNLEYEIRSAEIDERYRIKVFLDHKQVGLDYDCDGQDQGIKNALMEQVKSDIISGKIAQ